MPTVLNPRREALAYVQMTIFSDGLWNIAEAMNGIKMVALPELACMNYHLRGCECCRHHHRHLDELGPEIQSLIMTSQGGDFCGRLRLYHERKRTK